MHFALKHRNGKIRYIVNDNWAEITVSEEEICFEDKNYNNLYEVTVRTQEDMDDIPLDYAGRIMLVGNNTFVVSNRYKTRVMAQDAVTVKVFNDARIVASNNATVYAYQEANVVAGDRTYVEAIGRAYVRASGDCKVVANDDVTVSACGRAIVTVYGSASVITDENVSVIALDSAVVLGSSNTNITAYNNTTVTARESASVYADEHAAVVALDNAFVELHSFARVEAYANVQIYKCTERGNIALHGNARVVTVPKVLFDFLEFHNIKHTDTMAVFYKAVHKNEDGTLYSDFDPFFKYTVGADKTETNIDKDITNLCGSGIHISDMYWALDYGYSWDDMALLEVETFLKDIILPENSSGKLRTSKIKVLREVPMSEWGVYGTVYANKVRKNICDY